MRVGLLSPMSTAATAMRALLCALLLTGCAATRVVPDPEVVEKRVLIYVPIDAALTMPIEYDPRWLTCADAVDAAQQGVIAMAQCNERLDAVRGVEGTKID